MSKERNDGVNGRGHSLSFFGLAWLSLPGPYQDELLFINVSYPPNFGPWYVGEVEIFGSAVPTMIMSYLGALKGWLWWAIFSIWGLSIYSVRAPAVVLGAVALWSFYLFTRRFYGAATAVLATTMAALDPGYIFTARLDWGPVVLARVFTCAGLLCGARWVNGNSTQEKHGAEQLVWLAGAGLCFGLGLWNKAVFAWFLVALGATLLILFPREVFGKIRPRPAAVFLAAFLAGALPFIIYSIDGRAPGTSSGAEMETLSAEKMRGKVRAFQLSLDARFAYFWTGGEGMPQTVDWTRSETSQFLLTAVSLAAPPSGTLLPWALIGVVLIAPLASGARRPILFPFLVSALMWVQMFLVKDGGGGAHHWVLAYPMPHLAVAASLAWLWRGRRGRIAAGVLLAALLVSQVGWNAKYLAMFRETGGGRLWSDALYEIGAYIEEIQPSLVVNMDWGFAYPILLMTEGRVQQNDFYALSAFGNSADLPARMQRLAPLLAQPDTLFLCRAEGRELFPAARAEFERALAITGRGTETVRTFHQRNGELVAELVAITAGSVESVTKLGPPARLFFKPEETSPGEQYTIESADLAGQWIDLKYQIDRHAPEVALRFCQLDESGRATIRVPASVEPAIVDVLAVRISEGDEWRPTAARLLVRK